MQKSLLFAAIFAFVNCSTAIAQVNGTCLVPGGNPVPVGQSITLDSGMHATCVDSANGPSLRMTGLPAGLALPKVNEHSQYATEGSSCLLNGVLARGEGNVLLQCKDGQYKPFQGVNN